VFHIVLFEPEIPPNTGNIIRLSANMGTQLHLIHPLGFELSDQKLRRAGLDYREWASVQEYKTLQAFREQVQIGHLYALSTKGQRCYSEVAFQAHDALLFGPESRGLPPVVLESIPEAQRLHVPMQPGSRSLNLANVVALVLYEAWRQNGFEGATRSHALHGQK
jgi:tRNA (cytidine/uridine-2'-O-)-methyltransferase